MACCWLRHMIVARLLQLVRTCCIAFPGSLSMRLLCGTRGVVIANCLVSPGETGLIWYGSRAPVVTVPSDGRSGWPNMGCMSAYRVTLGLSIAVYVLLGCVTLPCTVLPFTVSNACQQTVQLQHWDLYCSPSGLCCMQSLLPADACWLCVAPCAVPPGMHAALL
ncbi:hypothetical protein COO60DRAFT_1513405, partial [Scenedesmus sp. NREL 46B-D3]